MAERSPLPSTPDRWFAAGVQHAVLLRALPAIRHDLVGPLSVTRMGTAVLKRHLAKDVVDGQAAIQRVEQIDGQLETLVSGVRALRHWDLHHGDRVPAGDAVRIATELARPALALRGVDLHAPDAWTAPAGGESVSLGTVLYLVLASIFYLQDDDRRRPAVIHIDIGTQGEVVIAASGNASPDNLAHAGDSHADLPIDGEAVAGLARHFGWRVELTPTCATIFPR